MLGLLRQARPSECDGTLLSNSEAFMKWQGQLPWIYVQIRRPAGVSDWKVLFLSSSCVPVPLFSCYGFLLRPSWVHPPPCYSSSPLLLFSSSPLLLFSSSPVLLNSSTPLFPYSSTPLPLYPSTPLLLYFSTPLLLYSCIPNSYSYYSSYSYSHPCSYTPSFFPRY